MNDKVSIIIPCFNSEKFLARTLQSIKDQDYKNYEVIIINDGSIDSTEKIVFSFDLPIIYYKQKNKGISASRNKGVELANGNIIAFLDHDDAYHNHKVLQIVVNYFNSDVNIDFLHGLDEIIDSDDNSIGYLSIPYISQYKDQNSLAAVMFYRSYLTGSGLFIKKNCFELVGNLDENNPVSDDYDLILRLLVSKCKIFISNEPLIKYRRHSKNTSKIGEEAIYNGMKSNEIEKKVLEKFSKQTILSIFNSSSLPKDLKHSMLGVVFLRLNQIEEAIKEFLISISFNPTNIEAQFCLGSISIKNGDYDKAILHYRALLDNNIKRPDVYNNMGVAYLLSGDKEKGIECFKKAIELKKDYMDVNYNLEQVNNLTTVFKITSRPLRETYL